MSRDSSETWAEDGGERAASSEGERYEDRGALGQGGMGEVRRVLDRHLGRVVARKAVREDLADRAGPVGRFVDEAQTTAQLQHPGIVPVYDIGELPDGRPWFTMPEIRGRTLSEAIREAHAAGGTAPLRRLVAVFAVICDTVAYAHGRGVVHRDLKPDNVMLGPYGEVLVLDWGLARRDSAPADAGEAPVRTSRDGSSQRTRMGSITGTPAYLAPEQARGDTRAIGPATDVWALGGILYHLLANRPPYEAESATAAVRKAQSGRPDPIRAAGLAVPDELRELCERAMAEDPAARPSAGDVAEAARRWLDGADREEKARALVVRAAEVTRSAYALRAEAEALAADVEDRLRAIPVHADTETKRPVWQLEDAVARLRREATLGEVQQTQLLAAALSLAPDLPEAHASLAAHWQRRHAAAEERGDGDEAARAELLLREHDRGEHAAYLDGRGAVTLFTDPPARADLYAIEVVDRRRVPRFVRSLGTTPLRAVELPHGSWVIELSAPGCVRTTYPIFLRRQEHWDGVPPEGGDPLPIRLPREGELGPDDVYVPAGWSWFSGDPRAENANDPFTRLWVDGFVARRHPVTNREVIAWLDALVESGREDEALRMAPRDRDPLYGRDERGRFVPVPDIDGDLWGLDWPVMMIDWSQAMAFAAWTAERTGLPWRLPNENEWEKQARGPDRRLFCFGDHCDPSWANLISSRPEGPLPEDVGKRPIDRGPYGTMDLAGCVREWGFDRWHPRMPVRGGRLAPDRGDDDPMVARHARGGCWNGRVDAARVAARTWLLAISRTTHVGMRLFRSFPA